MEIEEFARAACDMFERSDLVVGVSNTRHAPEYCGAVYYLMKLIESSTACVVVVFFPGFRFRSSISFISAIAAFQV